MKKKEERKKVKYIRKNYIIRTLSEDKYRRLKHEVENENNDLSDLVSKALLKEYVKRFGKEDQ